MKMQRTSKDIEGMREFDWTTYLKYINLCMINSIDYLYLNTMDILINLVLFWIHKSINNFWVFL